MNCERTIRGTVSQGSQTLYNVGQPLMTPVKLILDNGDITQNYRVTDFRIFPNMRWLSGNIGFFNTNLTNQDALCVTLGLNEESVKYHGEFSRSGQIGWFVAEGQMIADNFNGAWLDKGNLVVEDLWLGYYAVDMGDGSPELIPVDFNYSITIEPVKTTEAEGVLSIVREREFR